MPRMRPFTPYGDGEALYDLGERIRKERLSRNWEQTRLANLVGISRATVARIERGDPSVKAGSLARVIGILGYSEHLSNVIPDPEPPIDFTAAVKMAERMRARSKSS